MRAMILTSPGQPLVETQCPEPSPGAGQVLIRVQACAVCRTDLHILDGDLGPAKLPLILGHEIVGTVAAAGPDARRFKAGDRIGVPWLGSTCGACRYCLNGRENLCSSPQFTGYTIDGGFAEYTVADERFGFSLPQAWSPISASPLLCAGLIGYRSLIKTGRAKTIGIYGFGSAARIVTQVACHRGCEVYAFTRRGDSRTQEAAVRLGAVWAGSSEIAPPRLLEAAIIFAPSGDLVPRALRALEPGGILVCGGIHMSAIPEFPYSLLWQERSIASVANLTRRDGEEFLNLAAAVPLRLETEVFPLEKANEALERLRLGRLSGTAVLEVG